ncbi:tetratricopeptide repeat protein [Persicitalea sp.]|uniref:tetratricopeptide repeat protein n=1 Tax=Persicitalea sp. TaxID=3100273 RepID=UPI00359421DC
MQYVSNTRSLDTNVSSPPRELTMAERRVAPLFGEQRKTSKQIEGEIKFLNECDKSFPNRDEASAFFAARAWEYVQEGQLDTAAYRFNLAYLLDEKNVDAFWGLGVICYQKNDWEKAEQMLRRGATLAPDNVPLIVDLATVELGHFANNNEAEDLAESYRLLTRAASLDTTYAQTFANLALAEYHRSDFPAAWEALHKARKLNFSAVDFQFVELMKAKMPDPQQFFK